MKKNYVYRRAFALTVLHFMSFDLYLNAQSPNDIPKWDGRLSLVSSVIHENGSNIGIGTTSAAQPLTVNGNIRLDNGTDRYMLSIYPVLWNNAITSNIYVAVAAGNTNNNTFNTNNTLIGYYAGNVTGSGLTGGGDNTCIGKYSGKLIDIGTGNTLIGSDAGQAITSSNHNVIIGLQAGNALTDIFGGDNVLIGYRAGFETNSLAWGNTSVARGNHNCYIGDESGN